MNRRKMAGMSVAAAAASALALGGVAVSAGAATSPASKLLTAKQVGTMQPQLGAWTSSSAWNTESFTCEPPSVAPRPTGTAFAKYLSKQPTTDYVRSANRVLTYDSVAKAKQAEAAYRKAAAGGCLGHHKPHFVNTVTAGKGSGRVYDMQHARMEWNEFTYFEMVGVGRSGKTVTLLSYTNYSMDNNYEPGHDVGTRLLKLSLKKLG